MIDGLWGWKDTLSVKQRRAAAPAGALQADKSMTALWLDEKSLTVQFMSLSVRHGNVYRSSEPLLNLLICVSKVSIPEMLENEQQQKTLMW